jgi:hypothetical protein
MNDLANQNLHFQIKDLRRLTLFLGAYGSGKSEISVNFALWLAGLGSAVTICDLDIINPYYRSADAWQVLESAGIRLVKPPFAGTHVDVPAVPGEVFSVFDDPRRMAVLDIGGEDMGARVIAYLHNRLVEHQNETALYMVVNPCRPFTDTPEKIATTAATLQGAARMPLRGLVHNANLLEDSGADLLEESWPVISAAAARLGLPVVFAAAMEGRIPAAWGGRTPSGLPVLAMRRTIRYASLPDPG